MPAGNPWVKKHSCRKVFQHQCCLILIDEFLEWKLDGKVAQAYDFYLTEDRPFGFAGLCEGWEKDVDLRLESLCYHFCPSSPRLGSFQGFFDILHDFRRQRLLFWGIACNHLSLAIN